MERMDYILAWDKKQNEPKGRVCQKNKEHGKLGVHGSGAALVCGKCDFALSISEKDLAD